MAARRRRGFFLRRFSSGEAAEPGRLRICGRDVNTVLPEKPAEFSSRAGAAVRIRGKRHAFFR